MAHPLQRLNHFYYHVEKIVVVFALCLASVSVAMDVIHRRLVSPDSLVANLVLYPRKVSLRQAIMQSHPTLEANDIDQKVHKQMAPTRRWFETYLTPIFMGIFTYLLIAFAIRSYFRQCSPQDLPAPLPLTYYPLIFMAIVGIGLAITILFPLWKVIFLLSVGIFCWLLQKRFKSLFVPCAAGTISTGIVAFGLLMIHLHSRWSYMAVILFAAVMSFKRTSAENRRAWLIWGSPLTLLALLLAYWLVPAGFSWAKELSLTLMMWVIFLGGSMVTFAGRHIMLDFIRNIVRQFPLVHRYYEGLSALMAAGFCIFLGYLGYLYVFGAPAPISIYSMQANLPFTNIPSWFAVAPIPLGLATTCLRFCGIALRAFQGDVPEPENIGAQYQPPEDAPTEAKGDHSQEVQQ